QVLAENSCELVYVNSVAASEFVVAAKTLGKTVVLHVHEQAATLRRLMEIDLLKYEVLAMSDAVVLAADELRKDVQEVFGHLPERCMSFGIALDVAEIERLAREADAPAYNADGTALGSGERLVIGMCGTASARKGADIFFEVAAAVPEHDFLWVGPWGSGTDANPSLEDFRGQRLPNLFVTEGVSNPYCHIARLDLFFLSSREDPNPLVISEAMVLGVPILAFSGTTSVADFLGRNAILCYGETNTSDAVRVLRALDPNELRSPGFRRAPDGFREQIDMTAKTTRLLAFLASVQPV
ncbi:MAG: glycosyltransferase, partial [Terriglobia bacterium]